MNDVRYDVAIVGGGIVGLAHAWSAAKLGLNVILCERSPVAQGASIRNFGMIWPIGQPLGESRAIAMHARSLWLVLQEMAGVWVNECGSIHLAHHADEWAVLEEFAALAQADDAECELLTPAQVLERSPGANPQGLCGGLWSPTELCVNPRTAVAAIPLWLQRTFDVDCRYGTTIVQIDDRRLVAADGTSFRADCIIVCSGADFQTLYPQQFAQTGLRRCKLQMLKTAAQPDGWRLGPHLASGLTLRHYRNFDACASLAAVKARIAEESPELDRYGIHVMASQNDAGEVILGDSHEYGDDITPFDKQRIDELMLAELRKVIALPDWTVTETWSGIYAKHPTDLQCLLSPEPGVHIVTGLGGAGMTLSFGLAERNCTNWIN